MKQSGAVRVLGEGVAARAGAATEHERRHNLWLAGGRTNRRAAHYPPSLGACLAYRLMPADMEYSGRCGTKAGTSREASWRSNRINYAR